MFLLYSVHRSCKVQAKSSFPSSTLCASLFLVSCLSNREGGVLHFYGLLMESCHALKC